MDKENVKQHTVASPDSSSDGPSPLVLDSGVRAWFQIMGSFCLYFNTWGLLSSYGSFQSYYETELLKSATTRQISIIGSLQSFLLVFLGFLAGPIYDAGYARHLLISGSVLIFVGTVCQSFCSQFWQLLLAQGLCIGIGCGCLGVLSVAIPSLWFQKRLAFANAIAASGSGVGGVLLPIIIRNALPKVGFGWTVRIIALVLIILLGLANVVIRVPSASKQRRQLIDRPSLTDWPFVLCVFGASIIFLGLYSPFFYVESFATKTVVGSESATSYLVTAMNVASVPGRIIPGLLARRLGPPNLLIITAVALAAMALAFLGTKNTPTIYVVASIYGFFSGSLFALLPTNFTHLTRDMKVMGTRFGMAFTVFSVALLFGSPISGALHDAYGYYASWVFVATAMFVGGFILSVIKVLQVKSK